MAITRTLPGAGEIDVVLSGVSSDSHTWNLSFLQLLLEEQGLTVLNLGPCVGADEVQLAAEEVRPQLVVLSSVNGHGALDAPAYAKALAGSPATSGVPLVIGGKLDVLGSSDPSDYASLIELGFDQVFVGAHAIDDFHRYLDRRFALSEAS